MTNKIIANIETVFSTDWFKILAKTVVGEPLPYYSLQAADYVTVLALTTQNSFLLVRQFRPAVEKYTLELPSGHVEKDETPQQAALRELEEETGYSCKQIELLGCLAPDTGRLANRLWCYLAKDVVPLEQAPDLEAGVELVVASQQELSHLIQSGSFEHALHLAVLALAIIKVGIRA